MTWPGDEEEGDIDNDDDPEADNAIVDGGEDTDASEGGFCLLFF